MAGGEGRAQPPRDPAEAKLLGRLRLISGFVILLLVILLVTADTFGRLLVSPDFHVSEVIFIALLGSLATLLGFEVIARAASGR